MLIAVHLFAFSHSKSLNPEPEMVDLEAEPLQTMAEMGEKKGT